MTDRNDVERVSSEVANSDVSKGSALIVCSYDDDRCEKMLIKGALLKSDLEKRAPEISIDQEIIFYCN